MNTEQLSPFYRRCFDILGVDIDSLYGALDIATLKQKLLKSLPDYHGNDRQAPLEKMVILTGIGNEKFIGVVTAKIGILK